MIDKRPLSEPGQPPRLVVCADEAALDSVRAEFGAASRSVRSGFAVDDHPWTLDRSWVCVASGEVEVARAVDLLIRGASVAVCVPDRGQGARIWDEGRRVAVAEWYDAEHRPLAEGLDVVQLTLLLRISEGMDVETAARSVNLGARTAARRLAAARSVLGTNTTAAAAARVRSRICELRVERCG